ncbi:outer membrane lipoprotein-sorting protein [Marinobacter sp. F3R11]|uniref:outer membrane lipoprotein-sorting protein n=1 Tax=Marinobacter sp. F3R11 TaxID=2267231 RepID=UPI000DE96150|nr:outer membrane lipoprotein-sorting protein [Marinobacter sp. F3R11]RBW48911.1 outer membrane lipoprotein-sorting protein [Marinobacter sp. F3R11]
MKRWKIIVATLAASASIASANQGYDIAVEADRRHSGYGDSEAEVVMTLINKTGDEDRRTLTVKELEGGTATDNDKSLMSFNHPRDIAGTALLTWSVPGEDDLQWLYLPAIKRVKAISSSNRSGAFMGSEFTFEDLSPQDVDDYEYEYLGEKELNGELCFVYERRPKDRDSGYTKEVLWVDQSEYRTRQVHFYDHKNEHTKTLTLIGYELYNDEFWRPSELFMENHETGRKTRMAFSNYQFGQGLRDSDFNRSQLRYGR